MKANVFRLGVTITSSLAIVFYTYSARAANDSWSSIPTDGLWQTTLNWLGGTPPGATVGNTSADVATFDVSSTITAITNDANRNLKSIVFDNLANSYTIGTVGGNALLLSDAGSISTTSLVTSAEIINAPLSLQGTSYSFLSDGTFSFGNLTIGGAVTGTTGNTVLTIGGANTGPNLISGIIGNGTATSVAVVKTGAGNWTLSGANTYSGGTTLSGGRVTISTDANLGAVPVAPTVNLTFDGGTLEVLATAAFNTNINRNVNLNAAGGTLIVTGGSDFRIAGVIQNGTGVGDFFVGNNISGTGQYVPQGNNTYTGNTHLLTGSRTVSNVTAVAGISGPFGLGTLMFEGGMMRPSSNALFNVVNNPVALNADTTFYAGSTNTLTFNGAVSLSSNRIITQQSVGMIAFNGNITDGGSNFSLTLDATSTGVLYLGGTNTYGGTTNVNAGALVARTTGSLPGYNVLGKVTVAANATLGVGMGGTGEWTETDIGTLLTNATFNTTSFLDIDTTNATATVNYLGVIANPASGTIGLAKSGPGTLALASANTYGGGTVVTGGTLQTGIAGALGANTSPLTVAGTGILDLNDISLGVGTLSGTTGTSILNNGAGAAMLTIGNGNGTGTTYAGVVANNNNAGTGTLGVTKVGTGTIGLTGANTFSGGLFLNGGLVTVAVETSLGAAPAVPTVAVTFDGGGLQTAGIVVNANRTFAIGLGGGTINVDTGDFKVQSIIQDAVVGAGALNITHSTVGNGRYVPNSQSTYTGGTHLLPTSVSIINSNSTGSASTANLVSGPFGVGILYMDGGIQRAPTTAGNWLIGNAVQITTDSTFQAGSTSTLEFTGPVTLVGGTRTLTTNSPGNIIFSGVISDGGNNYGLTLGATSTNTLVLSGVNTYGGTTTIDGGTLQIGNGGTTGALGPGPIVDNATLSFNRTDNFTFSQSIGGTGGVAQNGTGITTLSGANAYGGATTVNSGGLVFANAGAIGGTGASVTVNVNGTVGFDYAGLQSQLARIVTTSAGAIGITAANAAENIDFSPTGANLTAASLGSIGNLTYSGTLTPNGGNYRLGSPTGTLTVSGPLSGANNVIVSGNVVFSTPKTYVGSTTVISGLLSSSSTDGLSANQPLVLGDATGKAGSVDLGSFDQTISSLTVNTTSNTNVSTITVGAGKTLTATGAVTIGPTTATAIGTQSKLVITGGGSLVVNAAGTTFAVGNGTGASGSKTTLDLTGLTSASINVGTAGTIRINENNGTNQAGVFSQLLLPTPAVSNTTPTTTLTAGTLAIGNASRFNSAAGQFNAIIMGTGLTTINATTINLGTGGRDIGQLYFASGNGTLTIRDAAGTGRAAFNMGTGAATTGTGTAGTNNLFDVSGHNVDLLLGAVAMGTQPRVVSYQNEFKFDTGTLDMLSLTAGTKATGAGTTTASVVLGFSGSTGTVNIQNGILGLGKSTGTSGGATGNFTVLGGTVTIGATTNTSVSLGAASAAGGTGNGNLVFSGGTITMTGDIVKGGGIGTSTATLLLNGATLNMSGRSIGTATPLDTITLDTGTLLNVAQINNGLSPLNKSTAGVLNLGGVNSYSGATNISNGTLKLLSGTSLPDGTGKGNVVLDAGTGNAGTLDLNGNSETINGLSGVAGTILGQVVNNGTTTNTLRVGGGDATAAFAGNILDNNNAGTGVIALAKIGVGTQTLSGINTYTGGTQILGGNLAFQTASALPATGNITINNAALNVTGPFSTVMGWLGSGRIDAASSGVLALTGNSSENIDFTGFADLGLGAASNSTYSGTLTPGGTTYKLGGGGAALTLTNLNAITGAGNSLAAGYTGAIGTLILANDNDYGGPTTITGVTVQVGAAGTTGSLGTNTGPIANNGGLMINRSNAVTLANVVSGTGTFAQIGAGTTTLTAANTFTGTTTISAGVLQLGNANALQNSTVNVNTATPDGLGFSSGIGTFSVGGLGGTGNFALIDSASAAVTLQIGRSGANTTYTGVMSGAGGITKTGLGTLTISNSQQTYTGATTILNGPISAGVVSSTLKLDFSAAATPTTNLISSSSTLVMGGSNATPAQAVLGGGTLNLTGRSGVTNSQAFAATTLGAGASSIALVSNSATGLSLNLGTVTRTPGATVNFTQPTGTLSATNGIITPGAAGAILTSAAGTAYATINGIDWAGKDATNGWVAPVTYTAYAASGAFTANSHVDVTATGTLTLTAASNPTIASLRLNATSTTATTLALVANTVTISSGGILFGASLGAADTISSTTGVIKPGAGNELVIENYSNVTPTISAILANGPGATDVTYRSLLTSGNGQITINGANTYTGNTYITAGRVRTAATGTTAIFGAGPGEVYINGTTNGQYFQNTALTVSRNFNIIGNGWAESGAGSPFGAIRIEAGTISGRVTLLGDATIGAVNGDGTISGQVTGAFTLTKNGGRTLFLTNAGTASNWDTTSITGGILQGKSANALSGWNTAGKISVAKDAILGVNVGGAGEFTQANLNTMLTAGNINFASGSFLGVDTTNGGSSPITMTGTSSVGIAKIGANTVAMNLPATFTGAVAFQNGIGTFAALSDLGAGTAINFYGGTLRWNTGNTTDISTRTVTIGTMAGGTGGTSGGTLDTNNNNVTFANSIGNAGNGSLTKAGAGILNLNAANTYTGTTIINQGTVAFGVNQTMAGGLTFGFYNASDFSKSVNVGTLDLTNASASFAGAVNVQTNSASANTITLGAGKTLTLSGTAVNVGIAEAAAAPVGTVDTTKLTIAGATNGVGSLVINNSAAVVQVGVPTLLQLTNATTNTLDVSTLASASFGTVAAPITTLNVGFSQTAGGTLVLSNTANSIAATTFNIGHSNGNNGGVGLVTLGTGTNTINADTLNIGLSKVNGTLKFASQTAGSPGTVTIANKTGAGATAIVIGSQNGTGTAAQLTGTLDLRGHVANVTAGAVTIGLTNGNLAGWAQGVLSFDAGSFTATSIALGAKTGTGTGGSTVGNQLNIGGGTFSVSGAVNVSVNSNTILAGGDVASVINISGGTTTFGTLSLANKSGATNVGMATGTLNVSGGNLSVTGATFVLATQTNGGTSVGTLAITGGQVTTAADITDGGGATTTSITLNGGTLNMNGKKIGSATVSIDTVDLQSGTLKNVAEFNNGAPVVKTTAGTLVLDGVNTYIGITRVSGGTLLVARETALYNNVTSNWNDSTIAVETGNTLAFNVGGGGEFTSADIDILKIMGTGAGGYTSGSFIGFDTTNAANGKFTYGNSINNTNSNTNVIGLTKLGTNILALTGINSYTGVTRVKAGTLLFGKQVSLYNNTPASWTDTNLIAESGSTLAFNVGGTGEFTGTDIDTLKVLGTASGGYMNGSSIGFDTTNAAGGTFTYANPIANTNANANVIGLVKLGTNVLNLTGTNTFTGDTRVNGGELRVTTQTNGANTTVATGAKITVGAAGTGSIKQATLTLNGDAVVLASTPLSAGVTDGTNTSRVTTLAIANNNAVINPPPLTGYVGPQRTYTGSLDLNNTDLIINSATLANVADMIRGGQNGTSSLTWDGNGLRSSYAATGPLAGVTGLGVMRNDDDPTTAAIGSAYYPNFSGVNGLTGGEILVKYTWYGDFDLSGTVDAFDFALLDAGYSGATQSDGLAGWFFGDANLDGLVDPFDFALLDAGYSGGGATTSLPEPGSLVLAGFGIGGLLLAYRRRKIAR